MRILLMRGLVLGIVVMLGSSLGLSQVKFKSPQPGEIYREYVRGMNGADILQVPDPNINLTQYPQVAPFIPAPPISIQIDDLSDAIRAEAMIVYIGGHISTIGQKMRWNGNPWIDIPLLDSSNGIPAGHQGYDYLMLHNVTLDIPLSQLYEGTNYFQGTSGTQGDPRYSFGWGQWGWYAVMVRIYYGPGKPHATGEISSPMSGTNMAENPTVAARVTSGSAQQIDFLAYYEDYDTDGDGIYRQYHHDYMMVDGQLQLFIKNHVGSATTAPWSATWNTDWVPDQPAGGVKLVARIKDGNGIWYVTPEISQLSLIRTGKSIKLYKPLDLPERCWVKGDVNQGYGAGYQVIHFDIPSSDKLADATSARYYIRLWNGANVNSQDPGESEYRHFNNWADVRFGADHHYTFDIRSLPVSALQSGTNTWQWYNSVYLHHGIEVLWPGPALAVQYTGNYGSPVPVMTGLTFPTNGSTGQPDTLFLNWQRGLAAASYDVQLSTDSLFGSSTNQLNDITDTSFQVGPLSSETKYFWRVRAKNLAATSPYSEPWSFTTGSVPSSVPSLLLPANNAQNQPVILSVRWHPAANAQMYHLQLGTDSTFGSGVEVDDPTIIDTMKVLNGLINDTKYYWHVRSANSGGPSAFSPLWNFQTIVQVPGRVILLEPADNAVVQQFDSVTCSWRKGIPSADRYNFEFTFDSLFTFLFTDSTIVDTFKVVHSFQRGRYWWRVAAHNVAGWGPFSVVRSFIYPYDGIDAIEELPRQITLSQNYPNPFNPTTMIRLGLPKREHTTLVVYNSLGQVVAELINGQVEAGFHEVEFNGVNLASGVYIFRLTAGSFVQSKPMVLLK